MSRREALDEAVCGQEEGDAAAGSRRPNTDTDVHVMDACRAPGRT